MCAQRGVIFRPFLCGKHRLFASGNQANHHLIAHSESGWAF
ncbi:Uncharacterised protein [Vibrio cholerae]|nr:Uncharacterised protein [Vibrio cholerae]CSI46903.1 Uncharacterised protein [Vibrio cholerae]